MKSASPAHKAALAPRIAAPEIATQLQAICPHAIQIVNELRAHGHDAYIVGGCIRDLLIGRQAKDFDVATDAHPHEVKALFPRSRIVGRRFQIVHVRFGREMIEVTTFRASHDTETAQPRHSKQTESGMLLRDNVYGDIVQDADRRDFTVNALYFDPADASIIDYVDGMTDLKQKTLRTIGEPLRRYQEDPVRMLRAARFAAKLKFSLHPDTHAPLLEHGHLLLQIAPARMFDEVLKLFLGGYALASLEALQKFQLFQFLFPATGECLQRQHDFAASLLEHTMRNTDARIAIGKPVTPAFLFAALLWPAVSHEAKRLRSEGLPDHEALQQAAQISLTRQVEHTTIPKRFSIPMREIWELQARLHHNHGKRAKSLRANPRFRAAYDFILLREQSGEELDGLGQWWTEYQEQNPVDETTTRSSSSRRKPRRRRRRPDG
ncbi:MAG: polynucleotide adenylyltransferase PcnB [Pseudomonadales bacterium]